LEQPWLVRYQFYLFEILRGKLQASKTWLQAKLKEPEASSFEAEKVRGKREKAGGNF
jgi:hypothetical protein